MINPAFFKTPDSASAVELSLQKRGLDFQKIADILDLSSQRGSLTVKLEELQKKRNSSSKELGKLKAQGDETGFAEVQKSIQGLGQEIKDAKDLQEGVEKKFLDLLQGLPNFLQDDVPEGSDENDNITIRQHGSPDDLNSAVPHFEICDSKNYVDFTRGAKLAGSRFYVYNEQVARLERLLVQFMLNTHSHNGYRERMVPFLVSDECMFGTGQFPKFKDEYYRLGNDDLNLIPTAEVPLTNLYADEILKETELPVLLTAATPCFRREAGSAGKDTRGLIRVHQFQKVELVIFSTPGQSQELHEKLTEDAEAILKKLNLVYRVQLLCSGDTSSASSKTYDLEVWFPGLKRWVEISSCSNFLEYQARRAKIRYKNSEGKNEYLHTLNGSGVAAGRLMAALMEYHQTGDDIDFESIENLLTVL